MKTHIHTLIAIISLLIFSQQLNAQVTTKTRLRDLSANTKVNLTKGYLIPAETESIIIDSGEGKLCSCKIFAQKLIVGHEYEKDKQLTLKAIEIKGLFDGSQMHVARVYFNETSDYFKFKCYARDILVEHVLEYLIFEENALVGKN